MSSFYELARNLAAAGKGRRKLLVTVGERRSHSQQTWEQTTGPARQYRGAEGWHGLGRPEIQAGEGGTAIWQPHFTGARGIAWSTRADQPCRHRSRHRRTLASYHHRAHRSHSTAPGSALGSGCGRTCSEHTRDRLHRHRPHRPGLGVHLARNAMPWQVSSHPKTRCANSSTCGPSSTNPLRGLLLPSIHREEPQHPRTPGAHAGTVGPIQQHPGEPKRGPLTPSLAGGCRHGRECSPLSITL